MNLDVDVRTYTSFTNVTPPNPVVNGAFQQNQMTFTPGSANDIVVVRAYYRWTIITPLLNAALVNLGGNAVKLFKLDIGKDKLAKVA